MRADSSRPSLPQLLHHKWMNLFFSPTPTTRLAVMRVLAVCVQLAFVSIPLTHQLALVESGGFDKPQWLIQLLCVMVGESNVRSSMFVTLLWAITGASGLLALIGVYTRLSLVLFSVGTMVQIAHAYSYGEAHSHQAILPIFLLLAAFGPAGDCLSLDALRRNRSRAKHARPRPWWEGRVSWHALWPMAAAQCLLALAYFDAALSKLLAGGLGWMNGFTLQNHLLAEGVRWERPLGVWLAQQHELCVLLSIFAIGFELTFFVTLLRPPRWLLGAYLFVGLAMYLGVYVSQASPYWGFAVLYGAWVPWERLPILQFANRRPRVMTATVTPQTIVE
jgi:hypothetical protein